MGSTVTPSSFFLSPSPDAVRVGRLIKNIKYPLEGYYDPTTDEPNVIETQVSASTINRQNSKTGFGSALKSSTSIEVSKRLDSQTHVVPADVKNGYYLDNSDAWFHKAVSLTDTRKWIEKAALSGGKIYIIVGIEILTNTRLVQNSQSDELQPTFIEKRGVEIRSIAVQPRQCTVLTGGGGSDGLDYDFSGINPSTRK
ncbi:hypothetical protein FOXB_08129 [Fusarium oxysporum f. sp. conglutinans Fo5176]|uniref:Uncharacterized protein n=1 Tax=Fusarium oxysporum (strain Fo5176) TaxID=660025 RepID=F9FNZ9_FUSOF|nr:hypothetical protein FOXB_08129 [Fusarium oxysporum f. sp. conglutinans Fo5176]